MVFQDYALYPHMTVADNMGFGLKLRGAEAESIRHVRRRRTLLGLASCSSAGREQLSGGQRQRVALGRAIVRNPEAFLMDEPLSNLDAKLRVRDAREIGGCSSELGMTTLYVTHDQTEAMTIADRVAVMRDGRSAAGGTPHRGSTTSRPTCSWPASSARRAMNLVRGVGRRGRDRSLGGQRLPFPRRTTYRGDVVVGIRPEGLESSQRKTPRPCSTSRSSCPRCWEADVLLHLEAPDLVGP